MTCSYHGRNMVLEVNMNPIGDRQALHHLHQRRWVQVVLLKETSPHRAGYLLPGQPGGQSIRRHRRRRRKIPVPRLLHHYRLHLHPSIRRHRRIGTAQMSDNKSGPGILGNVRPSLICNTLISDCFLHSGSNCCDTPVC